MAEQLSKEEALAVAVRDAAARAGVAESEVANDGVEEATFPNAALGAARPGEMSFDSIVSGWKIRLSVRGRSFEYRADRRQVRLVGFEGANHLVHPR